MKIKSTAQLFGVGLGTALGSLALMSAPAFSATLNFFGTNEDDFLQEICTKTFGDSIPDNCLNSAQTPLRIAELEGKEGGTGDHLFLSPRGSNVKPEDEDDKFSTTLDGGWKNGTSYNWTLTWDPTASNGKGLVTFKAGNDDLRYTYTGEFNTFNALGLITRADDGFDATMELTLNDIFFSDNTNENLNSSVSSTSAAFPNSFSKQYFILDDDSLDDGVYMTELKGTFKMSWKDDQLFPINDQKNRANARVGFKIQMFDPDTARTSTTTTPEPGLMLGLLGVGTLGLVGRKRKMDAK